MSADRARPNPGSAHSPRIRSIRIFFALLLSLSFVGLSACSGNSDHSLLGNDEAFLRQQEQALLTQRAKAVREDDLPLFLRGVDNTNPGFVARQRRYFANLQQLPLSTFRYRVLAGSWPAGLSRPSWGPDASLPQVQFVTQLTGFDTTAVMRVTGFAFARRDGRLVIVSDRTGSGQTFPDSRPAPWELTAIKVRESASVLGVYDARTYPESSEVNDVVQAGIDQIQSDLPFSWPGRVVVYVFADKAVLNSFDDVPGGNIDHLGAMTFPVYSKPGTTRVAGSRFTLLPSSVRAGQPFLGRIVRHELTHVAVGERDDGVPTWLAEGIAEYLGAREVSPSQRRIASVAVGRARAGFRDLPASATFNGPDQEWHYALSWMACDYIAATQGEDRLWQLMAGLHNGGEGTPDDRQDSVLESVIGINSHQLARRAAARIVRLYG